MSDDPGSDPRPDPDAPVRRAVLEVEQDAAAAGWDGVPRLFALVPTADLVAAEPALAESLGVAASVPGSLTPVEQEELPDTPLEELLPTIEWPPGVVGCAVVMERLMLPPSAEQDLPDDPVAAATAAAEHPDRQEVRLAVGVTRDREAHCAVRQRAAEEHLLEGPDLVPALVDLLWQTLTQ